MKHKWNRFFYALCALLLVCSFLPDARVCAADLEGDVHMGETDTEGAADIGTGDMDTEDAADIGTGDMDTEGAADIGTGDMDTEDTGTGSGTEMGTKDDTDAGVMGSSLSGIDLSFTDGWGNTFLYAVGDDGNAVVKGITVSGQRLVIPDMIDGAPVAAVEGRNSGCVVDNPGTEIESLYVNCAEVGAGAFRGLTIGKLEIGADVAKLSVYSRAALEHHYEQFAECKIEKAIYSAQGLKLSSPNPRAQNTYYGPFYGAEIHELEFSSGVSLIPENLFRDSCLQAGTLTIDVPEIGGYAFAGEHISIGTLVLGEHVQTFLEHSDSDTVIHYYDQFRKSAVGKLCLDSVSLGLEHRFGKSGNCYLYGPFREAVVGALEVGAGVEKIPEALLKDAVMDLAEYEISVPEIGAFAFAGGNISFGTLTIAESVTTFAESYYSYASPHYWSQFQGCSIESLVYLAESAVSSNDYRVWASPVFYGPFCQAGIGMLEIGYGVERIPDYFMKDARITLDDLVLDAAEIGAMSFVGDDVVIRNLTIGKKVERFAISANSNTAGQYWRQFYGQSFETVRFEAVESEVVGLSSAANSYSGPFVNAAIGTLSFGDEVGVIPRYCFQGAVIDQEELYVNAATIGSSAFRSADISIGTLIIGPDVESFTPLVYGVSNYFRQFGDAAIGTLRYEAVGAVSANSCVAGPFEDARIEWVEFGDSVEAIPNYLLYHAAAHLDDLTVNVPTIGFYSFSGSSLVIDRLTIGADVRSFPVNTSGYNRSFYESSIGSLYYNASAVAVAGSSQNSYGPFAGGAVLNRVVIGGNVAFLDTRLFRGNTIADCVVYPVTASAEYLSQTWNHAYLPSVTKLYIHHNSKFTSYFTDQVEEAGWMCEEFFELTYGERIPDGDTGEYLVQMIRHCPVCGYNEVSTGALDDSYNLFISLPLEIPLSYSTESKSYEGWGQVLVYGEIGNAYTAARVLVDTEHEDYGTARKGESVIDISAFFSTSFCEGDVAVFPAFHLRMNADAVEKGNVEGFYTDDLMVTVLGYAFLMSGPGEYRIPIPLKVVVY